MLSHIYGLLLLHQSLTTRSMMKLCPQISSDRLICKFVTYEPHALFHKGDTQLLASREAGRDVRVHVSLFDMVMCNHPYQDKIYLHVAVGLAACWSCDVFYSLQNGQLSDSRMGIKKHDRAIYSGIWMFRSRLAKRTYRATDPQNIVNEGKLCSKVRGYLIALPWL